MLMKVFLAINELTSLLFILGEFVTGFEHGEFTHMGNTQHISMYFFFGMPLKTFLALKINLE